ncbi:hypothetical protein [Clostridium faecium]|uniref:Uncharacterized protein n=1 Tax=Clostridium faecium TaxID=2762223 RepID=A0ABR8YRC5_9CLOT|nr:hypothetical protein [Clostridium faecium]MBD8046541.1 hypothetical protein [Clostridium faecium]MDU1351069.1 hypothetical protein [Clostridium argentinense]
MKKSLLILSLILVIIIIFCFNIKKSNDNNLDGELAIYLVRSFETSEGMHKEINDLVLEESPIITDEDIVSYDWKNRIINLLKDFDIPSAFYSGTHRNCVVMIGDERIYIGTIFAVASSIRATDKFPVFQLDDENPPNSILIKDNGTDINIDDIRIYKFLKK